jgi:hypothetical protein
MQQLNLPTRVEGQALSQLDSRLKLNSEESRQLTRLLS